jgi:hypothetical protein
VLLKVVYVLTRRILGLIVVLFRGDQAAVAERAPGTPASDSRPPLHPPNTQFAHSPGNH